MYSQCLIVCTSSKQVSYGTGVGQNHHCKGAIESVSHTPGTWVNLCQKATHLTSCGPDGKSSRHSRSYDWHATKMVQCSQLKKTKTSLWAVEISWSDVVDCCATVLGTTELL